MDFVKGWPLPGGAEFWQQEERRGVNGYPFQMRQDIKSDQSGFLQQVTLYFPLNKMD